MRLFRPATGPAWLPAFSASIERLFLRANIHPSHTLADAPMPEAGATIFVTDEAGGPVLAFGDGTNWRRVTDRAIIS